MSNPTPWTYEEFLNYKKNDLGMVMDEEEIEQLKARIAILEKQLNPEG